MSEWFFPSDGTINIIGNAPTSFTVTGEAAAFTAEGSESTFSHTYKFAIDPGFFILTGNDTDQRSGKRLTAEHGEIVCEAIAAITLYRPFVPTDPVQFVENAWVPIDAGLDAGLTVDQG